MTSRLSLLVAGVAWAFCIAPTSAQPSDPAVPAPPEGFDAPREGIAHGKLQLVEYESTTVGNGASTQDE